MSKSDPGEMTDSTGGSGGISDWALVNQDGHLLDDDTESSGSSVEVMEEGEEEEDDQITPVTGNSLSGTSESNSPGPRFVLRLASHEVADTDEEASSGARSESATPPDPGSASSESAIPLVPSLSEMVDTSSVTSLEVDTSSLDTDSSEVEASNMRAGLGRAISQEDIESLRQAIDDVQNSLLQTRRGDAQNGTLQSPNDDDAQNSPLQSESNDAQNSLLQSQNNDAQKNLRKSEPVSQNLAEEEAQCFQTSTKRSNSTDMIAKVDTPITSPDDIPEPRCEVIQDLLDRPTDRGDEGTAPDLCLDRQVAIPEQHKGVVKRMAEWLYDLYQQLKSSNDIMPWLFAVYLMLLCVIAYMIGVIAYHTASHAYQVLVPNHNPCPACPANHRIEAAEQWRQNWWDCQENSDNLQEQLYEASQIRQGLEQSLKAVTQQLEAVKQESNHNLQELRTCQAELAKINQAKAEIEGSCMQADNLENKPKTGRLGDHTDGNKDDNTKNTRDDQSTKRKGHHSKQKSQQVNNEKHADSETIQQKKTENERQEKKERKRKDSEGSHKTNGQKSDERSSGSEDSSGTWIDNVFDLMNRTKDQIEETWTQVRDISGQLWTKHSPALEKLQNDFSKKFQHLTDKLQRKLEKKAKRWFGDGGETSGEDEEKKAGPKAEKAGPKAEKAGPKKEKAPKAEKAGPKAETKRRPYRDKKISHGKKSSNKAKQNQGSAAQIISSGKCPPALLQLGRKVKSLNANKYRSMSNKKQADLDETSRQVLSQLSNRLDVADDNVLRRWVECQKDWWIMDEVGEGCEKYLQCWQVKVLDGPVKQCRKYKMEHGNILDRRCMEAPSHEEDSSQMKNVQGQHCETERDLNDPSTPVMDADIEDSHYLGSEDKVYPLTEEQWRCSRKWYCTDL